MEKREKVTIVVLGHVQRAVDAVGVFRTEGLTPEGILAHPPFQAAALRVAREELSKALAFIERTKWAPDGR